MLASTNDLELKWILQKNTRFVGACRNDWNTAKAIVHGGHSDKNNFIVKIRRNMLILGWER